MALIDTVLGMFTKGRKEPLTGSRSEREAKIKDKAGMVINVFAALLAFNTVIGGGLSSCLLYTSDAADE